MNVGAHLETFSVRVECQGLQFLWHIAHKWLSGQSFSLVEGG